MIDIMSMVSHEAPERQSKPCVLYGTGGFFKKAPELFTRNEKLAYIELQFSQAGPSAEGDKFVIEFRCSRLSAEAFRKAKEYGLYLYDRKEMA